MSENTLYAIIMLAAVLSGVLYMLISSVSENNEAKAKAECAKVHSVEECVKLFE